jgi:hypothetical protein
MRECPAGHGWETQAVSRLLPGFVQSLSACIQCVCWLQLSKTILPNHWVGHAQ